MNVVDSSAWLEYFAGGPNTARFSGVIEEVESLLVPSIVLLEVFRRIFSQRGEDEAFQKIAAMRLGKLVPLDEGIALEAARIGVETKLPLADSVIYATALKTDSLLWTQDGHFNGMKGVRFFPKPGPGSAG
jgi:toxin FitB